MLEIQSKTVFHGVSILHASDSHLTTQQKASYQNDTSTGEAE